MKVNGVVIELDNLTRKAYSQCPRKFYIGYVLNLHGVRGASALRGGITWHAILEGFYKSIKEVGWKDLEVSMEAAVLNGKKAWDRESRKYSFGESDYRVLENYLTAFIQYMGHFRGDEFMLEPVETEFAFNLPLEGDTVFQRNILDTIPPVHFKGRIDGIFKLGGNIWTLEYKTTGWQIQTVSRELNRNTAVIGYTYAGHEMYPNLEGCLVSIVQMVSRKTKDGSYGKLTIDFDRVPMLFSPSDLENWKDSFICTARDIYDSWYTGFFPMQFDSCYQYGSPCAYSRICEHPRLKLCIDSPEDEAQNVLSFFPDDYMVSEWDPDKDEV